VDRRDLTHLGKYMERDKPVTLPLGKPTVREADGVAGMRSGSKRMPLYNGKDRWLSQRATSPSAKAGRLPSGASTRDNVTLRFRSHSVDDSPKNY
jgi:hypothetical protein